MFATALPTTALSSLSEQLQKFPDAGRLTCVNHFHFSDRRLKYGLIGRTRMLIKEPALIIKIGQGIARRFQSPFQT